MQLKCLQTEMIFLANALTSWWDHVVAIPITLGICCFAFQFQNGSRALGGTPSDLLVLSKST